MGPRLASTRGAHKLAESGATVVLMSPRQPRSVATLCGNKHKRCEHTVGSAKWVLDDAHCQSWPQQIVIASSTNSGKVVESWLAQRPGLWKPLWDARNEIDSCPRAMTLPTENSPQTDLARFRRPELQAARAILLGLGPPLSRHRWGLTGGTGAHPATLSTQAFRLPHTMLHVMAVQFVTEVALIPCSGFTIALYWPESGLAATSSNPFMQ